MRIKKLQPYFYLSTGYGTVAGTTSIALGFYDCNDLLKELNRELRGFEYSFNDVVNIVRHELGHAFAYAYKLYRRNDFREVFKVKGNYFLTYPETDRYIHRANPWSRDYVNPSGDHYAQKHPDDDFAETFMVWLQPRYNWRREYRNYPGALRKLDFVKGIIEELRNQEPLIDQKPYDYEPLESFSETVAHFMKLRSTHDYRRKATGYLDPDLKDLFWRPPALPRRAQARARLRPRRQLHPQAQAQHRLAGEPLGGRGREWSSRICSTNAARARTPSTCGCARTSATRSCSSSPRTSPSAARCTR